MESETGESVIGMPSGGIIPPYPETSQDQNPGTPGLYTHQRAKRRITRRAQHRARLRRCAAGSYKPIPTRYG
jgi:hypothetical protein